jgi:hypothetical protein
MSTRVSFYLYWVWGFEAEEVESGLKDWSWMVERQRGCCRGGTEEYDL